jgi:hypothetical protein
VNELQIDARARGLKKRVLPMATKRKLFVIGKGWAK